MNNNTTHTLITEKLVADIDALVARILRWPASNRYSLSDIAVLDNEQERLEAVQQMTENLLDEYVQTTGRPLRARTLRGLTAEPAAPDVSLRGLLDKAAAIVKAAHKDGSQSVPHAALFPAQQAMSKAERKAKKAARKAKPISNWVVPAQRLALIPRQGDAAGWLIDFVEYEPLSSDAHEFAVKKGHSEQEAEAFAQFVDKHDRAEAVPAAVDAEALVHFVIEAMESRMPDRYWLSAEQLQSLLDSVDDAFPGALPRQWLARYGRGGTEATCSGLICLDTSIGGKFTI